jgi:1-acyl-sn-glycerol-3-phosphate acyltransferase
LTIFFRRVEVEGLERVPAGRPLLIVANHVNGLIDPLLLLGKLPLHPRMLGKSTLWEIGILHPFLGLFGVLPVYRRQDEGADPKRNLDTFARCHDELEVGGSISLFPEGTSHSEPALVPLKTGTARIALEAEAQRGPLGLLILPVGLTYEAKERFRSRALVQVGDPIDPASELALYPTDPTQAVRSLTARVAEALHAVTLNFGSWDEARHVALAAEIYAHPELDVPRKLRLADELSLRRIFLDGYEEMRERFPEEVRRARLAVEGYEEILSAGGLRDAQVAATYPVRPVLRFLWRSLGTILLSLPLAVVGTVLNWLPYRLAGIVARRVRELPDQQATYKLVSAVVLFPGTWLVESLAVGLLGGIKAAGLMALLAPASGWAALRAQDGLRRLRLETRAFLLLRTRGRFSAELRARRRQALEAIRNLVELYRGPAA